MTGKFEKRWEKTFTEMRVLKAEWLITRRCDLNCSYCKIQDGSTLQDEELDTGQLVRIVQMFGRNWPGAPMVVYGGEPTIRDDLPELLRAGRDSGVKLPVISNSVRVMRDKKYREKLVDSGLENWSVSFDGLTRETVTNTAALVKSRRGLAALLMFRDSYGIRDLVACVTVTRLNIQMLPDYLELFTAQGIHGIFTPLHIGDERYEYGRGDPDFLPQQDDIARVSEEMYEMVKSGNYLCSNDASWFKVWPDHFLKQDWMCYDKGLVTIDADGSLKYCVDIPFRPEDRMYAWDLDSPAGQKKFLKVVQKSPPCKGCLWNPAYECIKRSRDPEIGIEEGRRRSRHQVEDFRLNSLYGGSGKYFQGNPDLNRIDAYNGRSKEGVISEGESQAIEFVSRIIGEIEQEQDHD